MSNNIFNRVERAIDQAPSISVSRADLNAGLVLPVSENIYASTPSDFEEIMRALAAQRPGLYSETTLAEVVEHETDHARAAERIGVVGLRFSVSISKLRIQESGEEGFAATPNFTPMLSRALTLLENAAICVYPLTPSPGDMRDLRGYGYVSVDQVAEDIANHNLRHPDAQLPLPRSFAP